ncbi:MAG TPA: FHA domain-containing protein [Anaeromyxobacteraceae bacterium]
MSARPTSTLRLTYDDERGRRHAVALAAELTVGRAVENALRLRARNVSRRHALFTAEGAAAFVEDLGSRNGTFLNGGRLSGRRRVRSGDVVRVGDDVLHVVGAASEETLDLGAGETTPLPPPLPRRTPPPPPAPDRDERALALAAASPRPGRLKAALAAALRALSGKDPG